MPSLPWIEKYRPSNLNKIVGNKDAIDHFKRIAETGNIPHMILIGSPGTGKTTSVMCLAKSLLGDNFHKAFLELNASDERGIDAVRNKIKNFCKKMVTLPEGIHKIIFLDEVESMTPIAQQALRRVIEKYTKSTRFVMACNTSNQIIEAIQSRCSIIHFMKIDKVSIQKCLEGVCRQEKIKFTKDGVENIVLCCNGDMRRAVNDIQSVSIAFNKVNAKTVSQITNKPSKNSLKKILNSSIRGNFEEANIEIGELISEGYSSNDILKLFFQLVRDNKMSEIVKLKYLREIGLTQVNIVQGADVYIQLLSLIASLCLANKPEVILER
jgi:replication factor C subunit 2/4